MDSAFYVSSGGHFVSSELTRGPWDPDSQHAGPPTALIGRELERFEGGESFQLARVTFEILKPVPITPLTVDVQMVRPGRNVQLLSASLRAPEGEVIRALAWRLARRELELPDDLERPQLSIPGPGEAHEEEFFPTGQAVGYHTAMDYRFVSGRFLEPGPAIVWMRMLVPLVAGEQPTPLQRVLAAADSGNGVSATLDWSRYLFINVDLTVHLHRMPVGEWVCLDAITLPEPEGVGLADTALHDERGPLGRALQTLFVRER
jgi:Thioesterase-like superfamily